MRLHRLLPQTLVQALMKTPVRVRLFTQQLLMIQRILAVALPTALSMVLAMAMMIAMASQ